MTSHELARALMAQQDLPAVVAGHGRLVLVTHGHDVDGGKVVVLYVAEPEPEQAEAAV